MYNASNTVFNKQTQDRPSNTYISRYNSVPKTSSSRTNHINKKSETSSSRTNHINKKSETSLSRTNHINKKSETSSSRTNHINKRSVLQTKTESIDEIQKQFMLRVHRSTRDYNDHMNTSRKMSEMLTTTDTVNGLNKILAVMSAEELRALTNEFTTETVKAHGILNSNLKRLLKLLGAGRRISTKAVGFAMTNSVLRAGLERGLVRHAAKWLKVPLKTVGSAANVLNIVGLIGLASDLFATFVYDPYDKYKRHFSDSALLKLAETELIANQRNIGVRRVYITPYDWMVNTQFMDVSEDAFYDMVLAVMYMTSRRVNSSGGGLSWDEYGDLELNTDDDLFLYDDTDYTSNPGEESALGSYSQDYTDYTSDPGKESALGSYSQDYTDYTSDPGKESALLSDPTDTREVFPLGSGLLQDLRTSHYPRNIRLFTESWNLSVCVIALFILFSAVCMCSRKKGSCVFPVALFISLFSIAFPLARI